MIRLFILFFLFINSSGASFRPIEGVTPLELSHVVMELQSNDLFKTDPQKINELILKTDRSLSRLEKSDALFLIQTEIYKTLLDQPPTQIDGLVTLSASLSLKELNLFATKIDKIKSPFLSWMAKAVYQDLRLLIESPLFNDYKTKVKKTDQWNVRLEKMKKKFLLILPWYYYLGENNFTQQRDKIFPILFQCLKAVYEKSVQYSFFVGKKEISSQQLSYFKQHPANKKKPVPKNNLDLLLDSVIDKHQKPEHPVSIDDWVPPPHKNFDNDKSSLSASKSKNESLPQPTNDWILPGKHLPRPTDDWILPDRHLPQPLDDWILPEEGLSE